VTEALFNPLQFRTECMHSPLGVIHAPISGGGCGTAFACGLAFATRCGTGGLSGGGCGTAFATSGTRTVPLSFARNAMCPPVDVVAEKLASE
jgi:hypothetical protein